ncbi:CHAD domain-containing protein [Teredinibacter turnerae]|uniref:CHAD domain-containing protein n=1 Tax=Teredinibacter turnerae TaxID=2426 RepID=UPI0003F87A17|nr:CHAD domain-containing protein [Teredinibacter turnerae]
MPDTQSLAWPVTVLEPDLFDNGGLGEKLSLEVRSPPKTEDVTLLDDFDWHLWQDNRLLVKSGNDYQLLAPAAEPITAVQAGSPQFSWDFTSPALVEALADRLTLRALRPILAGRVTQAWWNIREAGDDKIVCRLQLLHFQNETHSQGYWQLVPLRGYQKEFDKVARRMDKILGESLGNLPVDLHFILADLALDDARPRAATIHLDSTAASEVAVAGMVLNLVRDAQRHVPGIIEDIDSEFLHDFRVQLRKARSLVQITKGALSAPRQAGLKTLLADVMRPTGLLRDLDVFLLEQQDYRSLLPEIHQSGFDQLIRNVKNARNQACKTLQQYLQSNTYSNQLASIIDLAGEPAELASTSSQQPIYLLVNKLISKRYRKICRNGLAITDDTPDEEVHNLRIECKKLRYLLTIFGELYDAATLKKIIKRMKRLQTILGNFNDYAVQQEFLAMQSAKSRSQPLQMAVSGLIAVIFQQQRQLRQQVCSAIEEFAAPETTAIIDTLLAKETEPCEL